MEYAQLLRAAWSASTGLADTPLVKIVGRLLRNPDSARQWLDLCGLLGWKHPELGLAFANRAVRLDPGSFDAWWMLHAAAMRVGDPGAAERAARHMVRLRPTAESWACLAECCASSGQEEEAFGALERAASQAGTDIGMWITLGRIALRLGDSPSGVTFFQNAVLLDPECDGAWLSLASLFEKAGDCRRAEAARRNAATARAARERTIDADAKWAAIFDELEGEEGDGA